MTYHGEIKRNGFSRLFKHIIEFKEDVRDIIGINFFCYSLTTMKNLTLVPETFS